MLALQRYIQSSNEIKAISNSLTANIREQLITGLTGSAKTLFFATLYLETKRPQLIVTHNLYQAQKVYDDMVELLGEDRVLLYPVNELISAEVAIASPEMRAQRIDVLNKLVHSFDGVVIAPLAGVRRLLPPVSLWKKYQLGLEIGMDIGDIDTLVKKLNVMGFKRVDMITAPGEMSVRGGIIDVYPLTEEDPIRIELFDTEIDSIRTFQADTQRSKEERQSVMIGPAYEILLEDEHYERAADLLEKGLKETLNNVKSKEVKEKLSEHITYEISQLKNRATFQGMYKYISLYYENDDTLLSYISPRALIILDETARIREMADQLDKEEIDWSLALLEQGEIIRDVTMFVPFFEKIKKMEQPLLYFSLFLKHVPQTNPENVMTIPCKSMQQFHGQLELFQSEVKRWQKAGYTIVFLSAQKERADRLMLQLEDLEIEATFVESTSSLVKGHTYLMVGALGSGFELSTSKLIVVTEEEIFTKKRVKRVNRKQAISNAERIKSYSELQVGDLVVHTNHGIGKYLGIVTLEINGVHKDYLHLRYKGNDKLYVPVDQIDLVQKYVGSEDKEPKTAVTVT